MSVLPGKIPLVVLMGSPRERGRQHGERFRSRIQAAIDDLRRRHGGTAFDQAIERSREALVLLTATAPDVAAELSGIADGADTSPDVVLLRSGFELFEPAAPAIGCTAMAFGGAVVAQNWDAPEGTLDELACFLHVDGGAVAALVIASVGALGWAGCNSHGLALVNNDLMIPGIAAGLPSQAIRRIVLSAPDVGAGVALMRQLSHMGGRSYLLGDADGRTAAVEVAGTLGVRCLEGDGRFLHTNHALDAAMAQAEDEEALRRTYPSSRQRLARLRTLATDGRSDPAAVAAMLCDHDGYPNSICKHPSDDEATVTTFSMIVDCASRTLHLTSGTPCRGRSQTVSLGDLQPSAA